MSEAAGAHTLNTNEFFKIDSVGKTMPGMQTMLFEQDANKQGEVNNWTQIIIFYMSH
jgi:long-subunit acyl-CoA synthetase (AMP-forming)